jgi:superfamily II DNA helicase RecQ
VVLRAPTGWGKSRIFQAFRFMFQEMVRYVRREAGISRKGGQKLLSQSDRPYLKVNGQKVIDKSVWGITIVITPLTGLGDAQVRELNEGLGGEKETAIFLSGESSENDLQDVSKGKYHVVYMTPGKAVHTTTCTTLWWDADFRHILG